MTTTPESTEPIAFQTPNIDGLIDDVQGFALTRELMERAAAARSELSALKASARSAPVDLTSDDVRRILSDADYDEEHGSGKWHQHIADALNGARRAPIESVEGPPCGPPCVDVEGIVAWLIQRCSTPGATAADVERVVRWKLQRFVKPAPPSAERILTQATDVENVLKAARAVLAAADVDVGIAELSKSQLSWICPVCKRAGACKADCTRNALLGALDRLSSALAAAPALPALADVDASIKTLMGELDRCGFVVRGNLDLVEAEVRKHFPAVPSSGKQAVVPWPEKITPALQAVLGLPMFRTAPVAHIFRAAGHDIPPKVEAEQAFVLFWAIGLALKHGDKWHEVSLAEIDALRLNPAPSTASEAKP